MLETGIRQFRMAVGMVWGRRLNPANITRLVEDALATAAEFGVPGTSARELVDGPFTDPDERTDLASRALRRTARRLSEQSPFYGRRFLAADINPSKLTLDGLRTVPVTVKRDLIDNHAEFLCRDTAGHLATRTTGTTGQPVEIWLSRYELQLWSAMSALTAVLRNEMHPHDLMQVHHSSRATASVHLAAAVCRQVGARCRILGVIPPEQALENLADQATILATSASYLGELVTTARRHGLSRDDFTLTRIEVGGEPLSPSLRAAAESTLGGQVSDGFGMTEVIPIAASTCSHGHLHHDLNMGWVEVLDLDSGEPAAPGALGTVVLTPYYPYRECMPVFRYDTRDVVRRLDDQNLTCELAGLPGTSRILGKANQILRLGPNQVITPRDLVEAVEALPAGPWPARFAARTRDARAVLTLPIGAIAELDMASARSHFLDRGLDVELEIVSNHHARELRPLRCDLHESIFAGTAPVTAPGGRHARN